MNCFSPFSNYFHIVCNLLTEKQKKIILCLKLLCLPIFLSANFFPSTSLSSNFSPSNFLWNFHRKMSYFLGSKKLQQYGIKKKEEKEAELRRQQEELMGGPLGEAGLNRAKKTPEELAAEAAAADQDDFTSKFLYTYAIIFSPISSPSFSYPSFSLLPSLFFFFSFLFFFFFSIYFLPFSGSLFT